MTNNAAVEGYRLARAAQDARFDARPGGGAVDHTMTATDEYREYFGMGEWRGAGTEERITLRTYLSGMRGEREAWQASRDAQDDATGTPGAPVRLIAADGAFWLSGAALRDLADAGCTVCAAEITRRADKRAAKRAARAA